MSHMVIYRTADGQPGYHQADALEEAVSFVERLRNSDGVDHARIFRMEEVTFDFRPYFRVEVGSDTHAVAAPPAAPAMPAPEARVASPFAPAAPAVPAAPAAPAAAAPSAPVDERNWMDLPIVDEPAETPAPSPEPRVADLSPFGEPAPVAEQGAPMFEAVPPPPPPPPPAVDEDSVGTSNGLGARRGLFGR